MASSIAEITMPRSIDFSRATASAICSNSSLLALTAMVPISSSRIDVASARAIGGEAVLLGILRSRLLLRLRFLLLVLFLGVRRFEPKVALELALGGLAAPHRFGDQLVG